MSAACLACAGRAGAGPTLVTCYLVPPLSGSRPNCSLSLVPYCNELALLLSPLNRTSEKEM